MTAKYFELEDLVFAKMGTGVLQLIHDGSWVSVGGADSVAEKLHFHGSEMTFDEVQKWAEGRGISNPKSLE